MSEREGGRKGERERGREREGERERERERERGREGEGAYVICVCTSVERAQTCVVCCAFMRLRAACVYVYAWPAGVVPTRLF